MRSALAALLLATATIAVPAGARAAAPAAQNAWPCWNDAARRYNVDVGLLYAIARVESGARSGIVSGANTDGTYDIGVMQINSWHLRKLSRYGITEHRLRTDACLNVNVGAWLLSQSIRDHGLNWRGVGAYNAKSDAKRAVYARKVATELARLREERRGQTADLAAAGGTDGGAK